MILEMEDKILDHPQEIAEERANYFEKLHKYEKDDDSEVIYEVERLAESRNYDGILSSPVSAFEKKKMVESLPNGRAPGFDGICYEHIKFGSETLLSKLELLFNAIIVSQHIPASFKIRIKIPIPKEKRNKQKLLMIIEVSVFFQC